jgi:hypothetical protein
MTHKLSEIIANEQAIKFDTNGQLAQFISANNFKPSLVQKKYGVSAKDTVIKFMSYDVYYTHNAPFNTSIHHSEIDMSC